ncbi:MAG: hypothetical protein DRP84_05270 [Spirochaetes bacterium]|nr:MAG: hypothetical protein DRP84_05270 [Spirochaetota bacterium]
MDKKYPLSIYTIIIYIIIVSFLLFAENAFSDDLNAFNVLKPKSSLTDKNSLTFAIVTWYQSKISSRNGPKCMFYPTCSDFFKKASRKYGIILATLMTVDRMFYRENYKSMRFYRYLPSYGLYYDPIENHFILKFTSK